MKGIFELTIYNRFKIGGAIAAELKPSAEHLRRWIAIYQPGNKEHYVAKNIPEHIYDVYEFELEKEKMADFVGDEDLIMSNDKRYYLNTEEELIDLLLDLHINPKLFTYPWRCDYPL